MTPKNVAIMPIKIVSMIFSIASFNSWLAWAFPTLAICLEPTSQINTSSWALGGSSR